MMRLFIILTKYKIDFFFLLKLSIVWFSCIIYFYKNAFVDLNKINKYRIGTTSSRMKIAVLYDKICSHE